MKTPAKVYKTPKLLLTDSVSFLCEKTGKMWLIFAVALFGVAFSSNPEGKLQATVYFISGSFSLPLGYAANLVFDSILMEVR